MPRTHPGDVFSTGKLGEELHQVFPRPVIDQKHPLFSQYSVEPSSLKTALIWIGVRSLEELTWSQLYRLMLRLPTIDPKGKVATRVYRLVADKDEVESGDTSEAALHKRFLASGQLWSRHGDEWSYHPLAEGVYFVADSMLPSQVAVTFPVVDLARGRRN